MLRRVILRRIMLCQVALLLFVAQLAGQETQPATAATEVNAQPAEEAKPPIPQSFVDEFRELICARVANTSDPNHDFALGIALEHGFKDERFNAGLFIAMRELCKPGQWDSKECSRVMRMFPLCDFKAEVKSRMLVEAYISVHKHTSQRRYSTDLRAISAISSQMEKCQNDIGVLVRKQIESGDFDPQVLDLFRYIQGNTSDLLPQLLESAKSDNAEMALATMNLLSSLMHPVEEQPVPVSIDSRYKAFADTLMQRYDRNGDRRLTPGEYNQATSNMSAYDKNKDGIVTYMECVRFLESRFARQEK